MIKFFRQIRFDLMEKNKTGKYLKYAIGEIVLVVIGILIALQINNWNENQKKEKLKVSFKNSLINDLSQDTLLLANLIRENDKVMNDLNTQRNRFLAPNAPIDTLKKIARFEFDPDLNIRFEYNRNTLNTLTASGNIDIFDKDFYESLITLISLQNKAAENSNYLSDIYATKLSRFSDDYPVSNNPNSNIINLIWSEFDERKLASSFVSLTDIKGYTHYVFKNEIEQVKEKTTLLLHEINDQP